MKGFVTAICTLLLLAAGTKAQDVLIQRDNGSAYGAYYNNPSFTNESVIIPLAGPCQILEVHVYYMGTTATRDTLIIAGDASEGAVPPTHWVWDYNLRSDPIVVDYGGQAGWKIIDLRTRNLRADGHERLVVQHWTKPGGPFFAVDRDAQTTPYWSFIMNPAETNSLGGPGKYYLSTNDFMVRLLVRYDYPLNNGSQPPPSPSLVNVTTQAGLLGGNAPVKSAIASVADWNNDGWDDIAIGRNYFRNRGDGTFERETGLGLSAGYAVWGDFDDDGLVDAYMANGGEADSLFRNTGSGFVNVTAATGIRNPAPTVSPVWLDYNNDGKLDLFLANGRRESGGNETYFQDKLWRNNGNGSFTDVTTEAGIAAAEKAPFLDTWGATACDYNNDGLTDIFVATYRLAPDYLYRNNGDGTFTEVGAATGARGAPTASPQYFGHGMGCDWGDFDNDGYSDAAVGNLGHPDWRGSVSNPSLILHNNAGQTFENVQPQLGLKFYEMNSGIAWVDLDNDGWLDLWQSQYAYQPAGTQGEPARYSRVYRNSGAPDYTLRDMTWHYGALIHGAWTVSRLDYDNDGDVDLLVASPHDGVLLFRNDIRREGRWLALRLGGKPDEGVTRGAFGTRVQVHAGGRVFTRTLSTSSAGSRAATHSTELFFGLGWVQSIDSVVVLYPNGVRRTHNTLSIDRRYFLPYDGAPTVDVERVASPAQWDIASASLSSGLLQFTLEGAVPTEEMTVELYSLLGQRLFTLALPLARAGQHSLYVPAALASGSYHLVLRSASATRITRVLMTR